MYQFRYKGSVVSGFLLWCGVLAAFCGFTCGLCSYMKRGSSMISIYTKRVKRVVNFSVKGVGVCFGDGYFFRVPPALYRGIYSTPLCLQKNQSK